MQIHWLNRKDNPDCILFMAGWGMAPEPFVNMTAGAVDVLMVYDYRQLDNYDLGSLLTEHNKYQWHLLAWSMGVWVAANLLKDISCKFSSATAIAGTCRPINDKFGIPCQLFDDTIDHFSPAVLTKFYSSMFETAEQAKQFLQQQPNRPGSEIKQELIALRAACQSQPEMEDIFQQHVVTSRDRIFPPRNQIRAWGRKNCATVAQPHFPFYQWSKWDNLLELV